MIIVMKQNGKTVLRSNTEIAMSKASLVKKRIIFQTQILTKTSYMNNSGKN